MSLFITLLLGLTLLLAPLYAAVPSEPFPVGEDWLCAGTLAAGMAAIVAAWRGQRAFCVSLSRAEKVFLVLLALAFLSIPARLIVQRGTSYFGLMLHGWAVLASYFVAFAVVRRVAEDRRLLYTLVFAAVAVSIAVADIGVQEYVAHLRAGQGSWRIFATSTPDYLAGYFVLTLPVALALFLEAPGSRAGTPLLRTLGAVLLGVVLLFQLAALLTTGSRFALVSLAVSVLVFAASLVRAGRSGLVLAKATRWLLGVLLIGLLLGGLVFARPVLGRLHNLNDNSAAFRVWTWKGAVRMGGTNPLLGTGIGTWENLYPRYAYTGFTRAAHSSYLQIADECGVPALLAFLAALGLLAAALVRGLASRAAPDRLLLCGLLAALSGGVVQNLIDSDWHVFFFGFTFWALAGLAAGISAPALDPSDATSRPEVMSRPKSAKPTLFAAGSVTALFAVYAAAQGVAAAYGARAQAASDPRDAVQFYGTARAWDPLNGRYPSELGYLYYSRQGDLTAAETASRAAVALEPNSVNYRRLGTVLQQFGRQDEALAAYRAGLHAEPNSLELLLDLARLTPLPRSLDYYQRLSDLELTPVGTVRALGEYTETKFAIGDSVLGDETAKTNPAQSVGYYARAARVLEQFADGGGSLNAQQTALNRGRPNPHQDAELRALYQHVMDAQIALAPPSQQAMLRERRKKYGQIYDDLFAQSSKPGML